MHCIIYLLERERRKYLLFEQTLSSRFTKLWACESCLACQHFISYHCSGLLCNWWCTSVTSIFWSILYKSELSTLKNVPLESQLKQDHCSNFLWKNECCFGISQENGADLSRDWQFMAGWKLVYISFIPMISLQYLSCCYSSTFITFSSFLEHWIIFYLVYI